MNHRAELPACESLPPPEYRLLNPIAHPEHRIPTPTDQYGLIDILQLIEDVKATVDPSYVWPRNSSVHHIYWEERNYPFLQGVPGSWSPRTFRELPIHKIKIPRTFENWLHQVTLEPVVPDPEIMHYRVRAFQQASVIYDKARSTVSWDRRQRRRRHRVSTDNSFLPARNKGMDMYAEGLLADIIGNEFDALIQHLDEQEAIPEEYRLIHETDSPDTIAGILGKLIVPKSQDVIWRVAA